MKKFSDLFKAKVAELDGVRSSEDVIIHFLGEEPENKEQAEFIRNTNIRYHGTDSAEKLLGNFAEIKVQTPDADKTNFIRVDLDSLLDDFYENGWDSVIGVVESQIRYADRIQGNAANVLDSLSSYSLIKDRIIVRAINFNEGTLSDYVYRKLGDIALVLYAVVFDDTEKAALNTIKIPRYAVDLWDISEQTVFEEAIKNTEKFSPVRLYTSILGIEDIPDSEADIMAEDYEMKHLEETAIPLVTSTRRTNGATALFYNGVKERIAEMFDGSFYVAFTSIHEAMIHKAGTINPQSIRRHIQATNRAFGVAETLSNEVYYYNRESGSFTVCEF